jgi:hypothetical protein
MQDYAAELAGSAVIVGASGKLLQFQLVFVVKVKVHLAELLVHRGVLFLCNESLIRNCEGGSVAIYG